jgi:hypothetical protein
MLRITYICEINMHRETNLVDLNFFINPMSRKGLALILILIVLTVMVAVVGLFFWLRKVPMGKGPDPLYFQAFDIARAKCGQNIQPLAVVWRANGMDNFEFTGGNCASNFPLGQISVVYDRNKNTFGGIQNPYLGPGLRTLSLSLWKISSGEALQIASDNGGFTYKGELRLLQKRDVLEWDYIVGTNGGLVAIRINATTGQFIDKETSSLNI